MARSLRILMVASEVHPFSKTGGLADVTYSLSRALGRLGHQVVVVTPRYRGVSAGAPCGHVRAFVGSHWFEAVLSEVVLGDGARAVLVECPPLYDRGGLYAVEGADFDDNPLRFAFLSIAALEWAAQQPEPFALAHAHDWQTGLLPAYLRRMRDEGLNQGGRPLPTVFTIHNLAFQGVFDKSWVTRLGLRWEEFTVRGFEFWDRVSFLKSGVMLSDAITTVSPTYADEIQRPDYGYGFDGVMRGRAHALTGILNGIDADAWNPARDPHLPSPFDAAHLDGKRAAKAALIAAFGLGAAAMDRPLVAMVSRMTEQKGLDLIAAVAQHVPALDASFVVVGTGEPRYERMWRSLAAAHPERVGVLIGFDEARAHLVEGGADLFLMPSRYEPCGLNQMYSMRYGTVPLVRAVGGLVDTVKPYNPRNGQGTGFLFSDYTPHALWTTLTQALALYRENPKAWRRLQLNGMKRDFSWDRSAAEYVKVYKRVIGSRQKSSPGH